MPQVHATEYFVVPQLHDPVASHEPPGFGGGLENAMAVQAASLLEPASRAASVPLSRPVSSLPPQPSAKVSVMTRKARVTMKRSYTHMRALGDVSRCTHREMGASS